MHWMDVICGGAVVLPAAVCWVLTLLGAFEERRP